MPLPDPNNPHVRPTAWTVPKAQPARVEPAPQPVRPEPSQRRNSIYSGSAIPFGPAPAPAPRPHPEIAPPGEPPPPLRSTTFVTPPPARPPARRERRSLRRHVPLIGSLATAAAGFAVMALVLTRPAAELQVPPPHRPAHLAVLNSHAPVAEADRPKLRGALQRLGFVRRGPARPVASPPSAVQPVSSAPAPAALAPGVAAQPKPTAPRFTPPPMPDPDAPIATRAPYG